MLKYLKGFKTIILMVAVMLNGALTAGGFWTPDMGADVTESVRNIIDSMELTFAYVQEFIGIAGIAVRAVTSTPIFSK